MNWINRYLLIASAAVLLILNEFTLVFFDPNPPLSERALFLIRSFNVVVLFIALNGFSYLKPVSRWIINYIAPSLIAVILLDIGLSILGFGYPSHYEQENIERYPSPMDGFSGKPDVKDHNNRVLGVNLRPQRIVIILLYLEALQPIRAHRLLLRPCEN